MSKYKNEKDVYIDTHKDKYGKDHIDIYDKDPKDDSHSSIHINIDTDTGKGKIVDTTDGDKEETDVSCYLTTACMRNKHELFDDNCEELTILRWFRDEFVSSDDINDYYKKAPLIIEEISNTKTDYIYDYIYDNVIKKCVDFIKGEQYNEAYDLYKNTVISLEDKYLNINDKTNSKIKRLK